MSLVTTFTVGSYTCHTLEGGRQRLDGGAMFGVVPKPLWERRIPADERNRIPLALRCLLVEHDAGPILVDTGLGNKESAKFRGIYGVENEGQRGPTQLDDALAEAGYTAADIRYVINTHLHFDHAGGNTFFPSEGRQGRQGRQEGQEDHGITAQRHDGSEGRPRSSSRVPDRRTEGKGRGQPQIAFPNATYVVQQGELDFATRTNERTAGSYFPGNFAPVSNRDRWQLVQGELEVVPGVRVIPTPGHVPYHQAVVVSNGGDTACFLGDLVPTTAHLPLPWIMGYDVEPLVTLETKRKVLGQAESEGWILIFEHDPERGLGRAVREGKSYAFASLDTS